MATQGAHSAAEQSGILQTFGIDWQVLLFNLISFLIVIFLLKKYVFNAVLRVVDERQKIIDAGVAQQEESVAVLEQAKLNADKIIQGARGDAATILTKAEQDELTLRAAKQAETESIVSNMIDKGEKEVDMLKSEAQVQIREHATQIVMDATRKIIEKDSDPTVVIRDIDSKLKPLNSQK